MENRRLEEGFIRRKKLATHIKAALRTIKFDTIDIFPILNVLLATKLDAFTLIAEALDAIDFEIDQIHVELQQLYSRVETQ